MGCYATKQKMKFSVKEFCCCKCKGNCILITFTEEMLNGKFHFFYSVRCASDLK